MRFFNKIYENNPELSGIITRLKIVPPSLVRVGSKKISFVNFISVCFCLNRDPDHLKQYLENEFGTTSSLDQNKQLLLRGRFQSTQIESIIRNYCSKNFIIILLMTCRILGAYVLCKTCKSSKSKLEKGSRLIFFHCNACGSKYSVDQLSAGYKALTTKRAAIRAKEQ